MHITDNILRAFIAIIGLLCVGVIIVQFNASPGHESPPGHESLHRVLKINPDSVQAGDIIFRRGDSFASRVVLSTDRASNYSHVGIIYQADAGPIVVHAAPGQHLNESVPVKAEPLAVFLADDEADAITVRRLKNTEQAARASLVAYSYVQDSVFFDASFDLRSPDRMYCTELVWRAYNAVDVDLVNNMFDRLSIPLADGMFILPSTLLDSPHLEEVLTIKH